ncbi:rhodanese-like domain-containing protein [Heyndrickxia acidicola]|uniref:Rhodanese-like domain-containing protein n=1 Tax=Heyndrickxia acidicola TaxID=209389 RepID=A0ABU6MGX7_9BACI|nr:rhodanese-like domain-containing protein [Heyndrickxia acidicola]MED1203935.1 rhodanese-like domain-containing protein [Heyndrickxia acidicola]
MSIGNILVIVVIAAFMVWRMLPTKGVRYISTTQLKSELNDRDKQYIDVRTPVEFRGNSIKGFKNIPLNQLAEKSSSLSKDKEVIVICQSGMRSSSASKLLKKQGFKKITNVRGGMNAWR